MKSVLNKIEKEKSKEIEFPVLAEALMNGETFVVLFLNVTTSVVVKGNSYNNVGDMSDRSYLSQPSSRWRILSSEESIVLSND